MIDHTFRLYPKITIITVCYNAGATIENTIKSIINQEYPCLEYIVIDGRSSDDTVSIINRYSEYIDYFVSEEDHGVYDAMNKGAHLATGDWICFLNADDIMAKRVLYNIADIIRENKDVDAIIGSAYYLKKENANYNVMLSLPVVNNRTLKYDQPFSHQALFIKKRIFDEYGYFADRYKIVADYDFILRTIYKGRIKYIVTNDIFALSFAGGISNRIFLMTSFETARCQWENKLNKLEIVLFFLYKNIKFYLFRMLETFRLIKFIESFPFIRNKIGYRFVNKQNTEELLNIYGLN
jgi:glycosyltransferase involved in cell wall biosynthesis